MKTKLFYLIFSCILLLLASVMKYAFKYQTVIFTLEEQIGGYNQLSGEETKLPTYWGYVDKVKFFLKDVKQLPIIQNKRGKAELDEKLIKSEGGAFYFAYPLSRLQVELFIEKAEFTLFPYVGNDDKTLLLDKGNSKATYGYWFTSYQIPGRKRKDILTFLTALADFQTTKARDMLMNDMSLVPFKGLHFKFWEIFAGKDKLYGKLFYDGGGGPEFHNFNIFISGTTLYFYISPFQ